MSTKVTTSRAAQSRAGVQRFRAGSTHPRFRVRRSARAYDWFGFDPCEPSTIASLRDFRRALSAGDLDGIFGLVRASYAGERR